MHNRQYERYKPRSLMQVVNTVEESLLGNVVNISLGGFMLTTHSMILPEGSIYQIKLVEEESATAINLGAICLWQTEANAANSHWAGFQIIDLSPEDEKLLESYIGMLES